MTPPTHLILFAEALLEHNVAVGRQILAEEDPEQRASLTAETTRTHDAVVDAVDDAERASAAAGRGVLRDPAASPEQRIERMKQAWPEVDWVGLAGQREVDVDLFASRKRTALTIVAVAAAAMFGLAVVNLELALGLGGLVAVLLLRGFALRRGVKRWLP